MRGLVNMIKHFFYASMLSMLSSMYKGEKRMKKGEKKGEKGWKKRWKMVKKGWKRWKSEKSIVLTYYTFLESPGQILFNETT